MRLYIGAIFILVCFSSAAHAVDDVNKKVKVVKVTSNGDVFVGFENTTATACSWGVLAVGNLNGTNKEQAKGLLSVLTAAKISEKPVSYGYTGCVLDYVQIQ